MAGVIFGCASTVTGLAAPHVYPVHVPGRAAPALAAPANARLVYYGGRVIANAQVVVVLYGAGAYLPQLSNATPPSIASFYAGVLRSPYIDWLREYDTAGAISAGGGTTHQSIGRGTYAAQYSISPNAANNGASIDDQQIQSELASQISAGRLPAPTRDGAGNSNTYYALYFPSGKTITLGTHTSCVANSTGFCAYHGTLRHASGEIYYGVHPDMQAGSGCTNLCGGSASVFSNQTSVASHELIEAITDPEVGIASTFGPPLGWYDAANNAEIGDLCNAQEGTVVGADGVSYTVQQQFSNAQSACIITPPPAAATVVSDAPVPAWAYAVLSAALIGVARSRLANFKRLGSA